MADAIQKSGEALPLDAWPGAGILQLSENTEPGRWHQRHIQADSIKIVAVGIDDVVVISIRVMTQPVRLSDPPYPIRPILRWSTSLLYSQDPH
jgi:hypothetical protein